MPALYRKWATARLRPLELGVDQWTLEEMYAGIGGQGAADGAYETALLLEYGKLMSLDTTGGLAISSSASIRSYVPSYTRSWN